MSGQVARADALHRETVLLRASGLLVDVGSGLNVVGQLRGMPKVDLAVVLEAADRLKQAVLTAYTCVQRNDTESEA